ncbi:uncharacterized protein TNCV_698811 [Trichonephila clavipes]|nr:uncharacterized protein TNCV_698811 [Trichonephila clavipes]
MAPGEGVARTTTYVVAGCHEHTAGMLWCHGSILGTCNGRHDPKCPSARRLLMVREDTWTPDEGATCSWIVADEAVGCTRAFLTMWPSSRRLLSRVRPELGLRVNDISRIHWSQHPLTTQSEQPNWRGIHHADDSLPLKL